VIKLLFTLLYMNYIRLQKKLLTTTQNYVVQTCVADILEHEEKYDRINCFVLYNRCNYFSLEIRYYKYFIVFVRPSVLDLVDCIQWSNIVFELNVKKTLIVLYTFSGFLKELGQKIFYILLFSGQPWPLPRALGCLLLLSLLCSLLCPVPQAFKRWMKC
jgi:hypothetical protein